MNRHPILSSCTKFELNWLRNKKVTKDLIYDGTSGKIREPKLEMTSYSDIAYDATNFFVVLKSSWLVLYSHCCQKPNGRVNLGAGAFLPPPSNIGVARTPSKIGLIKECPRQLLICILTPTGNELHLKHP